MDNSWIICGHSCQKTRLSAAECTKIFDFPQEIEGKTTKTWSCKTAKVSRRIKFRGTIEFLPIRFRGEIVFFSNKSTGKI